MRTSSNEPLKVSKKEVFPAPKIISVPEVVNGAKVGDAIKTPSKYIFNCNFKTIML